MGDREAEGLEGVDLEVAVHHVDEPRGMYAAVKEIDYMWVVVPCMYGVQLCVVRVCARVRVERHRGWKGYLQR